jgi:hypothetical protein
VAKVTADGVRRVTRAEVYSAQQPAEGHFMALVVWPVRVCGQGGLQGGCWQPAHCVCTAADAHPLPQAPPPARPLPAFMC